MNLYNNEITRRLNTILRRLYIVPQRRKKLVVKDFSILCSNCLGGVILHDLGLRFDTPTINMFFHNLDFFDFIEHFDYYIKQPLIQIENPKYELDEEERKQLKAADCGYVF